LHISQSEKCNRVSESWGRST